MGRPRPAVRGLNWHRLDSVPSPGPGQRKYLCAGVPKGGYSVRLLGAKTEIPDIVWCCWELKRKFRPTTHLSLDTNAQLISLLGGTHEIQTFTGRDADRSSSFTGQCKLVHLQREQIGRAHV